LCDNVEVADDNVHDIIIIAHVKNGDAQTDKQMQKTSNLRTSWLYVKLAGKMHKSVKKELYPPAGTR